MSCWRKNRRSPSPNPSRRWTKYSVAIDYRLDVLEKDAAALTAAAMDVVEQG